MALTYEQVRILIHIPKYSTIKELAQKHEIMRELMGIRVILLEKNGYIVKNAINKRLNSLALTFKARQILKQLKEDLHDADT